MAHARADNRYTRGLAEFVSGLSYERIPEEVRARLKLLMLDSLGCALFGADLEWSRILRRTLAAVDTSQGATVWGNGRAVVGAARGPGERHGGAGLRARRRASPGRAARRCRHAAGAVRRSRDHGRPFHWTRPVAIGYRRLRGRPARRHVHGAGAHRAGLALRRHRWRVLGRGRRQCRARAQRRADGARARHRRHAVGRADGGAVRRHGQAHACGTLVAERALRGAAGARGLHRYRRRVRERVRRLLHYVLTLAGSFPAGGADRGSRRALGDAAHLAQVLFLRRQQPHHARRHPHHAGARTPSGRRTWSASLCTARR